MEYKLNNLSAGRPVVATEIMENDLQPIRLHEHFISRTVAPEYFGLFAPDEEYVFDLGMIGNTLHLRSLHALLPNGHAVRFSVQKSRTSSLNISIDSIAIGEYFLYLVYKDWAPTVSAKAFGKTVVPDSFVPTYELVVDSKIKPIRDYPQCLLLGKFKISANATILPTIDGNHLPLISQIGAHPRTQALLEHTKAQTTEMAKNTEVILSQLQLTLADSIFRDIKLLAQELRIYLRDHSAQVRHWGPHTPLFDVYCFWSTIAGIFKTWLDSDLVTQRLHSHDLLHRSGSRVGQIQMENHLITTIDEMLEQGYDMDDISKVVQRIEQLITYPVLAWLALGDGTPIPVFNYGKGGHHQIKTITR